MEKQVKEVGEEDGSNIGPVRRRRGEEGGFGREVEPLGKGAGEEAEERTAGSQHISAK